MSLAPDPELEERLLHAYCDAAHAAGIPESELTFEGLQDRVDALMIEVVVHFTTVRVFGEAAKDESYELSAMMRKMQGNPNEQDTAKAFIAVDSNALGRAVLLWKQAQPGGRPAGARLRAARFFAAEESAPKL